MGLSDSDSNGITTLEILRGLVISARLKQWTKNLIVYFALFFTINDIWDPSDLPLALTMAAKTTLAFLVLCVLSSGIYLINDICDAKSDQSHPRKKLRPIASGKLPIHIAWLTALVFIIASLSLSFYLNKPLMWVAIIYVTSSILYSLALRRIFIVDILSISCGFVLRAVAGAVVLSAPISPWLYACTGLGALLISICKRRGELSNDVGDNKVNQRETLSQYTTTLLDLFIAIVAPSTLIAYTLYTFISPNLPDNHAMMLTIPIVVYGLFRYLYLVHSENQGENPEDILVTDTPLIISVVLWLITAAAILVTLRTDAPI